MSKRGRPKKWDYLERLTPIEKGDRYVSVEEQLEREADKFLHLDAWREKQEDYPILTPWHIRELRETELPDSCSMDFIGIGQALFTPKQP